MSNDALEYTINYALNKGCNITVWGGGDEPDVLESTDFHEVYDACHQVDMVNLYLNDEEGYVGTIAASVGLEPEEQIIDYGCNDWTEAWWNKMSEDLGL